MAAHLFRAVSIPNKPNFRVFLQFLREYHPFKVLDKNTKEIAWKWPFFSFFFVLAIKFHRMNLFQNRFHRWSTFWPYFPMTPIKVNIMAIIGVSHNTHYGKNGHYGCYGSTNYGCKFDLYGCSWKICSKCRSPVKTVLKKIHPMEFYGQNKKNWEKMSIFSQFSL